MAESATPPPYNPVAKRPVRSLRGRLPVESDTEWGAVGYLNRWGGFHGSTDAYCYWTWLKFAVRDLFHRGHARVALHYMHDRWRHRRCDTVDFHHFGCTLDPFGKRMDDNYRWHRVWTSAPRQTADSAQD